jgi:queuine tRNA-ribosyltransferase
VQGGTYNDLRIASSQYLADKNAAGNAIGGLSVGEPEAIMYDFTALSCEFLPVEKPRYLMGVGTPWNILESIALGVDMFDCVMPTRNGRNGMVFTSKGVTNIKKKKWATDLSVIDDGFISNISNYYTKAYLTHLFAADEILALQIACLHNRSFYLWLVGEARNQILNSNFYAWKQEMVPILKQLL